MPSVIAASTGFYPSVSSDLPTFEELLEESANCCLTRPTPGV